jgi:hypothetical protein
MSPNVNNPYFSDQEVLDDIVSFQEKLMYEKG